MTTLRTLKLDKSSLICQESWRAEPAATAVRFSRGAWKRSPHLNFISEKIAQAAAEGGKRLIIELPPRHGKSELCSHWTPVWFLANWPQDKIILASYEAAFAASWGRKARDEVLEYSKELGIEVRKDVAAIDWWELTDGGGMVTAGVGGPVTGKGGKLIILDDPVKNWEEARSIVFREKTWDWFGRVLYTRLEPGASVVILMQRWHRDDIAGRLERETSEKWERIRMPAIAEKNDILGRSEGEALWPVRFNEEALDKIRHGPGGEEAWLAQYQQRPEDAAGDCFFNEKVLLEYEKEAKEDIILQHYSPLRRYTAWIDAAGVGSDYPSLSIVAWYGTQTLFVVDYTENVSINQFCLRVINDILPKYQNPLIGWERNGVGEAVYQIFKAQDYPDGNIYYQDREKGKHGVAQTGSLRDLMLVKLASGIDNREVLIESKMGINECLTFVKHLNGPPRAASGARDDRVMAMAGALWLSTQSPYMTRQKESSWSYARL